MGGTTWYYAIIGYGIILNGSLEGMNKFVREFNELGEIRNNGFVATLAESFGNGEDHGDLDDDEDWDKFQVEAQGREIFVYHRATSIRIMVDSAYEGIDGAENLTVPNVRLPNLDAFKNAASPKRMIMIHTYYGK